MGALKITYHFLNLHKVREKTGMGCNLQETSA